VDFAKVLSLGKKAGKGSKKKGGAGRTDTGFSWPAGVRIGVYGHWNSGKTVYFTVLNEDCKFARDLQIAVTDNATAAAFLAHREAIWGVAAAAGEGTRIDTRRDRKFPDSTKTDRVLQFTAILGGGDRIPIVSYDYPGDAVAIGTSSEFAPKVRNFTAGCDGLLFFFDPKALPSESDWQSHAASFVNMLRELGPLDRNLSIPIGLVVTKADSLPGFRGEAQVSLVPHGQERTICREYEEFLVEALAFPEVAGNQEWAGSVREILVKTKEFIRVVLGRTLDFQIFFVSSTGSQPEKIGAEKGRSLYRPPEKMSPVGLREPIRWLLQAVVRNRRLARLRTVKRYVRNAALLWILVCSLAFGWHLWWQLGRTTGLEDSIRHGRTAAATSTEERNKIGTEYNGYAGRWLVAKVFSKFQAPAREMAKLYRSLKTESETSEFDEVIQRLAGVIKNETAWPAYDVVASRLQPSPAYVELREEVARYAADSAAPVGRRAARVMNAWSKFDSCQVDRSDSQRWSNLQATVNSYQANYKPEMNPAEIQLYSAFTAAAAAHAEKVEVQAQVEQAGDQFADIIKRINGDPTPAFRLDAGAQELRDYLVQLQMDPQKYGKEIKAVTDYLSEVKKWESRQTFNYRVDIVPDGTHLHMQVVGDGEEPNWSDANNQLFADEAGNVMWKVGDVVYVVLHKAHVGQDESWGRSFDSRVILRDPYALFELEKEIKFGQFGSAKISFVPKSLSERLPVLKK